MRDFRSLKVWEKAHQLTLAVYQALHSRVTEVKRMLSGFLQKLSADR